MSVITNDSLYLEALVRIFITEVSLKARYSLIERKRITFQLLPIKSQVIV